MARAAIVQSYPYEASRNGDAAYIAAIRRFLISRGHEVVGIVSDLTRGRTSPVYRSAYDLSGMKEWKVQGAFRLGDTFISSSPGQWLKILRKPLSLPPVQEKKRADWTKREADWVAKIFSRIRPDCAILLFDACGFSSVLNPRVSRLIALPCYLRHRSVVLGESNQIDGDRNPEATAEELSWLKAAPCVGFHSADDVQFAKSRGIGCAIRVGIGVAGAPRSTVSTGQHEPIVLLVAANSPQNVASLRWFLHEVWPQINDARPDARLRLVGPFEGTIDLKSFRGVDCIGYVSDVSVLDAEYDRAQVAIAPLTIGSRGVKVKVAEALSYGCPLVTTSLGIDAGDPEQFAGAVDVADTPVEFAEAVLRLLREPDIRRQRATRALEAFKENFSFEAAFGELVNYLGL